MPLVTQTGEPPPLQLHDIETSQFVYWLHLATLIALHGSMPPPPPAPPPPPSGLYVIERRLQALAPTIEASRRKA
jgi:hypothetical protein